MNTSPRIEKTLARLMAASIGLLSLLVVAELCAKYYIEKHTKGGHFLQFASSEQIMNRSDGSMREHHRYIGYIPKKNYLRSPNRHNALGFRGDEINQPKPSGEYRIICIGGSTTYSSHVKDFRKSYPARLEANLRSAGHTSITVINAGMSGYNSWESLINFQLRLLDLDPDMIIVQHGVNDSRTRMVWPTRFYTGDNSGFWISHSANPTFGPLDWLAQSSAGRILYFYATGNALLNVIHAKKQIPASSLSFEYRAQVIAGDYPKGIFNEIDAKTMLRANPPIYFERNIENIVILAQAREIDVVLATFATCQNVARKTFQSEEPMRFALEQHNDLIRQISERHRVPMFDYQSVAPTNPAVYSDDVHLNETGLEIKARLFAKFIGPEIISKQGQ